MRRHPSNFITALILPTFLAFQKSSAQRAFARAEFQPFCTALPPPPFCALFCRGGGGKNAAYRFSCRKNLTRPAHYIRGGNRRAVSSKSSRKAHRSGPPSGLVNLGNTCYLNAMVQSQYHIPLVRRLILEGSDGGNSAAALSSVFQSLSNGSSSGRTDALCAYFGINPREQQDATEFWKLLLPHLELPALSDLYTGKYESYVEAADGSGRRRVRTELFTDLNVGVDGTDSDVGTLNAALEMGYGVASEERISGWRAPPVEGFAERVDARKGVRLMHDSMPSVLQVTMRRFSMDYQFGIMRKLNDRMSFDQVLDLSLLCCSDEDSMMEGSSSTGDNEAIYDLQSIVIHAGEYGAGHYYSYVRPDVRKDVWYRIDDQRVSRVRYEEVEIDATGGPSISTNQQNTTQNLKEGHRRKRRWFRSLFQRSGRVANSGTYGYGGRGSSAYMLQYVRRRDICKLYD
uniref:Ubiquitin carboxyl-terminal hydrolase n=1 Tax=Corethron hystrix TaxID=216773 RepID=A0A7S1BT03_9STRA|mmetsp:Transcript_38019/g.88456  ORF Transcript_38019/g.88456 Transcript_38019/m.88456 type:complete len:458 (+) Transcript_38019:86-1459(+)